LVNKMVAGHHGDMLPQELTGKHAVQVIYRNLPLILAQSAAATAQTTADSSPGEQQRLLDMALSIDRAMHEQAPAGWRGDTAREAQVLNALYPIMDRDREATRALFELIKQQAGYR